jgi:hypothetical protein
MKVFMDTTRPNPSMRGMVECTANVSLASTDVQLSVLAFGMGEEGTNKAFERMERVLDSIDILGTIDEKVRVH